MLYDNQFMPYYRITWSIDGGKSYDEIRDYPEKDVDFVYRMYNKMIKEKWGASRVVNYNCIQLSKHHMEQLEIIQRISVQPENNFGLGEPPENVPPPVFGAKKKKEAPKGYFDIERKEDNGQKK